MRFHQFAETLDLKPQRDKGLRLEVQGLLLIFEQGGGNGEITQMALSQGQLVGIEGRGDRSDSWGIKWGLLSGCIPPFPTKAKTLNPKA